MIKDISFSIPWKLLQFVIHVYEGHAEGRVSQIFYLGRSFSSMRLVIKCKLLGLHFKIEIK